MEREIDLKEISDGRLYECTDMVKLGCNDCEGCSACCRGMGSSIILDPYDMWQFAAGLSEDFGSLMEQGRIELNMADGVILPNLKLAGDSESCTFLTPEGRCAIHAHRPGLCRLFPLGRNYEGDSFHYFLQVHECRKGNRTKVKIRKWLEIADIKSYEQFIRDWHRFLKDRREQAKSCGDEERIKQLSMEILKRFYLLPYDGEKDFYIQFYDRMQSAEANS